MEDKPLARSALNLLVNRLVDSALASCTCYASGKLIDIGCGTKQYERLFAPFVETHIGVDHEGTPHGLESADIIASAYEIPVESGSFDTVLCTCVLEHLEDPPRALKEARRVVRRDGYAIYVAPFIWHLHEEPRDFYRFSSYGLRYLFEDAGFEVVEVRPLGGFWATFGQLLAYRLYRFYRRPIRPLVAAVAVLIQAAAACLDRIDAAPKWTANYLVVARAR